MITIILNGIDGYHTIMFYREPYHIDYRNLLLSLVYSSSLSSRATGVEFDTFPAREDLLIGR